MPFLFPPGVFAFASKRRVRSAAGMPDSGLPLLRHTSQPAGARGEESPRCDAMRPEHRATTRTGLHGADATWPVSKPSHMAASALNNPPASTPMNTKRLRQARARLGPSKPAHQRRQSDHGGQLKRRLRGTAQPLVKKQHPRMLLPISVYKIALRWRRKEFIKLNTILVTSGVEPGSLA